MSVAPFCPISRSQPTAKARQLEIATIPKAHNLITVITAINRINNLVQHVTQGQPQINNVYPATVDGVSGTPQYSRMTWKETSRGYTQQRVTNPDDPDQFVEIKTLSYVEWQDEVTEHRLRYKG